MSGIFKKIYLLDLLNFLSCPSPIESRLSLRLRWQALLGEGFCECSTSLETGVESVERSKISWILEVEVFSLVVSRGVVGWWTLRWWWRLRTSSNALLCLKNTYKKCQGFCPFFRYFDTPSSGFGLH